jgi:hypothetical protein
MCLTVTEPSLATSPGFVELQAATKDALAAIVRKLRLDHAPRTRRA